MAEVPPVCQWGLAMVIRGFVLLSGVLMAATLGVLGLTAVFQVATTAPAAAAGSSVGVFAWGDNTYGQLGNGTSTGPNTCNGSSPCGTTPAPVLLPAGVTPTAIAGAGQNAYAIGSDGKLYAWGANSVGGLGNGDTTNSDTPVVVSLPAGVTPTAIAGAEQNAYAIGSDGNLYAWGNNTVGQLGNGTSCVGPCTLTPVVVSLPSGVTPTAIAADSDAAYAIGSDGKLYAWGGNSAGELGNGTSTGPDTCFIGVSCGTTPAPVLLPSGVTPTAIAGGYETAYALGSDGNLYAWGEDSLGELGTGTTGPDTCMAPVAIPCGTTPAPVLLPSGVTFSAIAGGSQTAFAVGSNGKLYAWGDNDSGKLGNGTSGGSNSTPAPVLLPSGVAPTAIAGGGFTAYALGSDGKLYAWGENIFGGLGNGTSTGSASTPVVVPLPSGSAPMKLGPQELAFGGYAIVNAPNVAPTITTQPVGQSVFAGQDASFSALAPGLPTPTVQWQVSTDGGATFSPVSGATSDTLTIAGATLSENGNRYRAVFTNSVGSATSNSALLTVNSGTPVVTVQPANQSGLVGSVASFTAAASGSPAPTVQWQYSTDGGSTWIDCPVNAMSNTVQIGIWASFENGWLVRAVFTNGSGSATSNTALLTVTPDTAPVVTVQPANQSGPVGSVASFTASASGGPAPTVQWQYSTDGGSTWIDCPVNAMSDTVQIGIWGTFENGWQVRAVFTNGSGSATSNTALLTVS
jgi:alpha-tubulin suppressor-like RCC1 family protein